MKLSYSWLKDYLECDLTPAQVADAMTAIGIEVDSVEEQEEIPGGLAGVVVAQVLECEPHPDSDHLHVTKVDDGSGEPLTVVCGAPNVAAGQKVLFARIGTVLPGDFKIKRSKIRGIESLGMICAKDELGIGEDHSGIMVLEPEAVVGTPAKDYLHLKTEAVIEYEITANRVDAASHIGVARDLYAWLRSGDKPCKLNYPDVSAFRKEADGGLSVEVIHPDVIYFASIVGIDRTYYEAAEIDGASAWDQVWSITIPLLKPVIITMTLLALGRVMYSDFGLFYQVPQNTGLLFNTTNTIDTYVYRGLLESNDVGRAAAANFIQSILGFLMVLSANAVVRKIGKEYALF